LAPRTQLLNVAYARHEIVGETTDFCLAWLEERGKVPMSKILQLGK